jgi:non-specific serine/threonine protein kinase
MSKEREADSQLYRYRFGSAEFDESNFVLLVDGRAADVQRKPLEVLALLLSNAGEVVTREELLDQVWDNRPTVEHVINNALVKLRAALGGTNAAMIVTHSRVGYRFEGKLERAPVGRAARSDLALREGEAVPGRSNFLFERMLGRSREHEVWLARHQRTGEKRVYKFCIEGGRLAGLKREATLARVLREQLGPREDLVRMIDWNFEHPPYYLESEFGGASLRDWAKDDDRLASMRLEERLQLFLQIADAVGAAHSVGVIHKDLKPANVLVSPTMQAWRVKIADFGSGRLLDPERLSELTMSRLGFTVTEHPGTGSDSGTPLYLAPELLAGGAATIQSDVYALGLLLYQLLVGDLTRPLVPGWDRHIENPLLRADVAEATDVDPAQRTSSALLLAQRLRDLDARGNQAEERRLADRERQVLIEKQRRIAARAPWVRSTFALLVSAAAIASVFYWSARRDARQLAAQNEVVAKLNAFLTDEFISAANPDVAGSSDVTVASAAHAAASHIDQDLPAGPYAVRAALHTAMQHAFSGLTDYVPAVNEGRFALRDLKLAGGGTDPDAELKIQLRLASDLVQLTRIPEAEATLERVDQLMTSATPPDFHARAEYVQGLLAANKLHYSDAISRLQRALEFARNSRPEPADLIERIELSIGDTLTLTGKLSEGEQVLRQLLDQQTQSNGPGSIRAEITRIVLATNLGFQKRFAEGEKLATQAATHCQAAYGPDHRNTLRALLTAANLQFQQDHYREAAASYTEIYQRIARSSGPRQDLALAIGSSQAMAVNLSGDHAGAAPLFREQLRIAREFLADDTPRVQNLRYHLADVELDLHHHGNDVEQLLKGLDPDALSAAQTAPDWDGRLAYQAGRLSMLNGNVSQARESLRKALTIISARNPDGAIAPQSIRNLLNGLGRS